MNIEELGFTKEELQQRVVDQICEQLMSSVGYDEEGDEVSGPSAFSRQINDAVRKRIDKAVNDLADKHILPNVTDYIEKLTIQETTRWGEKTGNAVTFIEYLTQRAEHYLREEVDYEGKSKAEKNDSYGWRGTQTRLTALVHKHLHYSISTAMQEALQIANSAIASGIQETVKLKLKEITEGLQVAVSVKK